VGVDAMGVAFDVDGAPAGMHRDVAGAGDAGARTEA
jgi:hypothetical protein